MRRLLNISQTARQTGMSTRVLRIYADKGLVRCYRNPVTGYRKFKLEEAIQDLKKLKIIAE